MSVVGCQWYVRTFVSVMNLSILSLYTPSSVSSDCKILLLLLHQLSLARVLVGDVLVGLLVCWCVGCRCVGCRCYHKTLVARGLCPCVIRYGMETSVSVPFGKSAIVAPGESIDSSRLPKFHKILVARGLCPCVTRYGMETSVSVPSQNPGGTRTLSLCHQVWHGDFGLCAIREECHSCPWRIH